MENPALSPFLTNIPTPPPATFFLLFQKIVADENKYSGLGILENQFSGRAHAENK